MSARPTSTSTRRRGFTLLELIIAIVILAVLATIAIPTFAHEIAAASVQRDATSLTAAANDVRSITTSAGAPPTAMPSSADVTTGLGEVTLAGVGPLTGAASTTASPVSSTSYGTVSYDNADSLTQIGYAMQTQNGDCTMDLTTGNTTQSWRYTTNLGSNCNGSLALAGPGQSTPAYVASYDQLVSSLSPAAWWKLSDASGSTTAVDSSGNGHTGTVNGGVTLGQTGPVIGTPADTGALFDGASGAVKGPSGLPSGLTQFTWNVWVNHRGVAWSAGSEVAMCTNYSMYMNMYAAGIPDWSISTSDGQFFVSGPSIPSSGWHLLTLTWDGSTGKGYLDGVLSGSVSTTGTLSSWTQLIVGNYPSAGSAFNGDLAQVAIFPTALTAAQIASLYAAG